MESTRLHTSFYTQPRCQGQNLNYGVGKYYSIYLSKISVDKLNEWRPPTIFNLTAAVEGFMNNGTGRHNIRDTLTLNVRESTSPFNIITSAKSVIDSVNFTGKFTYNHLAPGNYYLSVEGRNSLETWSASTVSVSNGVETNYDFTNLSTQTYGGNVISKGGKYCNYSGEVTNDANINLADISIVYAAMSSFQTGYVVSDLNGDYIVNLADLTIVNNNSNNFVHVISP